MIVIKNSKADICDYRIPYDININEEIYNMKMLIEKYKQKLYKRNNE